MYYFPPKILAIPICAIQRVVTPHSDVSHAYFTSCRVDVPRLSPGSVGGCLKGKLAEVITLEVA